MELSDNIRFHIQPSGLNSKFEYNNLNFSAYMTAVTHMLRQVNQRFNLQRSDKVITLNSPFEWKPKDPTDKAVLLIHGLFDTPFIMRDTGKHLLKQGYWVRSILLPGHGTIPADLLTTSASEWMKAIAYGIESFPPTIKQLYLVGFSTGAALSLNYVLKSINSNISGLIMLSPAFALNTKNTILVHAYRTFRWLFKQHKWIFRHDCPDYTKYTSFPVNSAFLVQRLIVENRFLLKKQKCNLPIFMVVSTDDETIRTEASIKFFQKTTNKKNLLYIYTNQKLYYQDKRIHLLSSKKPDENILDFSHVSLLVSPENFHYGRNGDHQEPLHEPKIKTENQKIYLGAASKENENHYRLRRLTFNPYFSTLMKKLDEFMQNRKANPQTASVQDD